MATPDPSVLRALTEALETDPLNIGLRMHLSALLIHEDPLAALEHAEVVLRQLPDSREALRLASQASRALGDTTRADAWERLANALDPGRPASSPAEEPRTETIASAEAGPVSSRTEDGHGPVEDWDRVLAEVVAADKASRTTLQDVAGLEEVKARLEMSFLGPLRNPELRAAYGATLHGGLLLWGPPGCGKTFLARAVAGELGAHFTSVGIHDVLDMWLGSSERHLHRIFEAARRRTPTVLFFDEVDAIGHNRSDLRRSAGRNVVAQLLTELDGIDSSNDGVFIIGATNQPWDVDPAMRRPGRLDRTMLVLPPDADAREALFTLNLRGKPTTGESLTTLVAATEGFSGADIRLSCEDAMHATMAQAAATGVVSPIGLLALQQAVRKIRPSTIAWFEAAANFAAFANADGEYDELLPYLGRHRRGRR